MIEQGRTATGFLHNDPLLRPLTIKKLTLRNRFMSTSHACGLEKGGMPEDAYQRYHEEKAKGGVALSMFGGSSNVDRDSPNIFRQLNVGSDEIIPHFQKFSERMHSQGAALMCQISHLGRRGDPYAGDWISTIGASPLRETLHRGIPKEMDEYDIDRVVKAYGEAARRCDEGGLDGIETLSAGHLIGQFLSPSTNRRTDRFGGSLENRCRFALMAHEAIRKSVRDDFVVGIRFVVDEGPGKEMRLEECIEAALILQRHGAIDFFNAIYGTMDTFRSLAEENMPGMGSPLAPWVEPVGTFRQAVGLPVFHAARIADIASARFAIAEGKVDMAGMTRAQIADPYLVEKLMTGREAEVRPCVGATHCQSPYRPSCLHNPSTGRETRLSHKFTKAATPKKVVVIGAGPAGLEAARVSAERGHDVSIYEAAPRVGGQILVGATGSWRRELLGIVEWRESELSRLGVQVHTNRYMEADDILALNPDKVVIATGGLPKVDLLKGADLCHSTWDVLTGVVPIAATALVYDGTGRHPAPLAAECVKLNGGEVHFYTIDTQLAEELTYAERVRWKKIFWKHGLRPTTESRLIEVVKHEGSLKATLENEITQQLFSIVVDQVIVEQGSIPMDDTYQELRRYSTNAGVTDIHALVDLRSQPTIQEGSFELHRVGDAVSSRNIHTAVLDALRIASVI